ncbi:hypothetical protein ACQP1O_42875 (plasmid) [Nocardia sp. CA-151230]|uniref:hypothetical protein n=1 Tax=Nocardia sp. CA-151230 TaxID=3239982 RepID=UPI003D90E566
MGRPKSLTPEQARELVKLASCGSTDEALAERYSISIATVSDVRCGRRYSAETGAAPVRRRIGPRPKLSTEQAEQVLTRFRMGVPRLRIAREFNVNRYVIDRIVTGRGYWDATGAVPPAPPSQQEVAAARNLKRSHQFRGRADCVTCGRRLHRTSDSVQKSGGFAYCDPCVRSR